MARLAGAPPPWLVCSAPLETNGLSKRKKVACLVGNSAGFTAPIVVYILFTTCKQVVVELLEGNTLYVKLRLGATLLSEFADFAACLP